MAKVRRKSEEDSTPRREKKEGSKKKYLVSLPNGPQIFVDATSRGDAWLKYQEVCGLRSTDYQPHIQPNADPADYHVNEHGVVVDQNTGAVIFAKVSSRHRPPTDEDEDFEDGDE